MGTFAVGDRVTANRDITEDMAFRRSRSKDSPVWVRKGDVGVVVDAGAVPLHFDLIVHWALSEECAVKADWLDPAAPAPAPRDVVAEIVTALENIEAPVPDEVLPYLKYWNMGFDTAYDAVRRIVRETAERGHE